MFSAILGALAGLLGAQYLQDLDTAIGNDFKRKIQDVARQIQKWLVSDNEMFAKFQQASADKRQNLLSAMMSTMGFGPQLDNLRREYAKVKKAEDDASEKHRDYQSRGAAELTRAQQADVNTQGFISGAIQSQEYEPYHLGEFNYHMLETTQPQYGTPEQNIKGGIQSAQETK